MYTFYCLTVFDILEGKYISGVAVIYDTVIV